MEIQRQRQKLEDFKQLKRDYDSYESNREVLEKCKKKKHAIRKIRSCQRPAEETSGRKEDFWNTV